MKELKSEYQWICHPLYIQALKQTSLFPNKCKIKKNVKGKLYSQTLFDSFWKTVFKAQSPVKNDQYSNFNNDHFGKKIWANEKKKNKGGDY